MEMNRNGMVGCVASVASLLTLSVFGGALGCGHEAKCFRDSRMTGQALEEQRAASAEQLFAAMEKADGLEEEDFLRRQEAFKKLLKARNADPWLIVILLGYARSSGAAPGSGSGGLVETPVLADRPKVAEVLANIRDDAAPALLWAVTSFLRDSTRATGSYTEVGEGGKITHGESLYLPMRDLARNSLKRALGVDCAYDTQAWRATILDGILKKGP